MFLITHVCSCTIFIDFTFFKDDPTFNLLMSKFHKDAKIRINISILCQKFMSISKRNKINIPQKCVFLTKKMFFENFAKYNTNWHF